MPLPVPTISFASIPEPDDAMIDEFNGTGGGYFPAGAGLNSIFFQGLVFLILAVLFALFPSLSKMFLSSFVYHIHNRLARKEKNESPF